ncbi:hypothetical protein DMUE_6078 [Dictyocoela muelleri]|nr:hypothetical protein DMUE_6078 [Dictyocoela muelleri]
MRNSNFNSSSENRVVTHSIYERHPKGLSNAGSHDILNSKKTKNIKKILTFTNALSFDFEICGTKTRTSIQIPIMKNPNEQPLTYWVDSSMKFQTNANGRTKQS